MPVNPVVKGQLTEHHDEMDVILRTWGVRDGVSDKVVRMTHTRMFGAGATAEEFGPEPTGAGVRAKIQKYL